MAHVLQPVVERPRTWNEHNIFHEVMSISLMEESNCIAAKERPRNNRECSSSLNRDPLTLGVVHVGVMPSVDVPYKLSVIWRVRAAL
jgi:hypothetical protein